MSKPNVDTIVVHYTATYGDQPLTAADVDKMHRARGWQMIGYHWFIRRDGTVEQGRPETMIGAHVANQNTGKIGISWAGGLDRATGPNKGVDNRTPAQTKALIALIRDLLKRYPGAKVVGHRDLAATQCPGFDVPAWWASVQKQAAPAPVTVKPTAPVKTPGLGEETVHVVRPGETWWSISRLHGLALADLLAGNGATEATPLQVGRKLNVAPPPPKTVTKEVVPTEVEREVESKTGRWQWITGMFGGGGLGIGALAGFNWQTIVAGGGVVIVMLIVILLLRRQLVGAVKEIRQGLA